MFFRPTTKSVIQRAAIPLAAYLFAWIPIVALAAFTSALWWRLLGRPVTSENLNGGREAIAILLGGGVTLTAWWVHRWLKRLTRVSDEYNDLIESAPDGIFIMNPDGRIEANSKATEMLSYQPTAGGCPSCPETSGVTEDLLWTIREAVAAAGKLRECRLRGTAGKPVVLEVSGTTIEQGGAIAILRDVSERKSGEKARNKSERPYRALFEQGLVGVFSVSRTGVCLDCNDLFARLLGYQGPKELIGKRLCRHHLVGAGGHSILATMRRQGCVANQEVRLRRRDGATAWVLVSLARREAEPGLRDALIGTVVDLSPIKSTEEQLRVAVREKEVLLKEVHHRVKNNLQIIASLLHLQSDSLKMSRCTQKRVEADCTVSSLVANAFEDCRERINAIAMVHETLYRSEDVAQIDFPQYVRSLVRDLRLSFGRRAANVTLRSRVEIASLGLDAAIPCGLIINELVSNSVKYGFPDGRQGTVDIEMTASEDSAISLTVRDSGVGLPPGLDPETTDSLGMRLVAALVRQLRGKMDIRNENGSRFAIRFRTPESIKQNGDK